MGQSILDGFERGFGMMERHKARVNGENRRNRLDEQNESRYQDNQTRLADIDDRNENRYQESQIRLANMDDRNDVRYKDGLNRQKTQAENTANHRASMLEQQEQRTSNQQSHYQWQKNEAEEKKQWGLIAPQMQNIHQEFFNTGKLPEQAAKFFEENPQYNDYNPASYQDPEYRNSVKMLRNKTTEIFKGKKLHEFKSPEYIKLFDQAFQSKIQQGVGEVDVVRNAKVLSKEVAQLIPTRNGKVSIGLKVTYQDDKGETYTEIQPMTKGRTSDQEDPVNEWELKELLSAIETRSQMADMVENGEHYLNRSGNTLKAMGFGGAKDKKAYRKELSSIYKDLANAVTKIQGDSNYMDEESRNAAIKRVEETFKQRKASVNKNYGVDEPEGNNKTTHDDSIRNDGTQKGNGYFGVLKNSNGQDVTEFSIGIEINGKETEIPTLVPTLTKDEIKAVLLASTGKGEIPRSVMKKASEHAKKRMSQGLSPFNDTDYLAGKGKSIKYTSTVDGQDVDGVIGRFMSANKGMTEQQAIAAATNQGYLTNDE